MAIREKVGVASIQEKMKETRLRWFEPVKRSVNAPVRKCETMDLRHCRRGRRRPKKNWNEVIKGDLNFMGLTEDMAQDRSMWRSRTKTIEHR